MGNKINVCVLFGGVGNEEEVSCNSGINCVLQLSQEYYNIVALRLLPDKTWQFYNRAAFEAFGEVDTFLSIVDINQTLDNARSQLYPFFAPFDRTSTLYEHQIVDVFLNVIHGIFGEDGQLSCLLDQSKVPYVGPSFINGAVTMDKKLTQDILTTQGILVPTTVSITSKDFRQSNNITTIGEEVLNRINTQLHFPILAKPNTDGSSVGLHFFDTVDELQRCNFAPVDYLFQDKVSGIEFTVPVLRIDDQYQSFKSIMIKLPENGDFDYKAKYLSTETQEICPAPIDLKLESRLQQTALDVNKALNCSCITRTDLIYSPDTDTITVLEVNTVPGLTKSSFVPKFCAQNGLTFSELLDQLIRDTTSL